MSRYVAMRIYTVPEGKLDVLLTRFRDHAVRLFERHGLQSIGYWTARDDSAAADAPDKVVYLLAAPSREHYLENWRAFRADPEWLAARRESERGGRLVLTHEEVELTCVDFSPIQ